MIIWGFKSSGKTLMQGMTKCKLCGNKTVHSIGKLTKWFTLYFIPVIPYNTKMIMVCHACGARHKFSAEDKQRLLEDIENRKDLKLANYHVEAMEV